MPTNYNTRLRTHAQILPPRRLRQSPAAPLPSQPPKKYSHPPVPAPPTFPPPNSLISPDDAANKTFLAIGRALWSIENRAITIKDLSYLVRDHGLPCQNVSAASQAITTFIRQHLQRCREEDEPPLLLSLVLTGVREYDDPLAPALHSRSGGTPAQVKDTAEALTKFRKGTSVWYLSPAAGAPCPFTREGISVDVITDGPSHATKRKRELRRTSRPRKIPATIVTVSGSRSSQQQPARPRIKLTLRMRPPDPESGFEPELSSPCSQSGATDSDGVNRNEMSRCSEADSSSDASDDSGSEADSSMDLDDTDRVSSEDLPGYPFTPSIPSPDYSTPLPSVASSSAFGPLSPYLKSNFCSSHFIKNTFSSFHAALSNPSECCATSLPFSAPTPPDSEDEDEDYHNSMVGMRRETGGLFVLKEEEADEPIIPMFDPVIPKYLPGGVHYVKPPNSETSDVPDWSNLKQEKSPELVSTPLETLPGFLSLGEPTSSQILVKDELASAVLPSETWRVVKYGEMADRLASSRLTSLSCDEDEDVELLGPESVRIREWDAAWSPTAQTVDIEDIPPSPPPSDGQSVSPLTPSLTSPMAYSTLNRECILIDETIIDGVSVYRTFLAPELPLLRRVDNSHINITPLLSFLNISLAALLVHVTAPRITVSFAKGVLGGTWIPLSVADTAMLPFEAKLPANLRATFFSTDLETWLPMKEVRVPPESDWLSSHADEETPEGLDARIRVEDLFEGDYNGHNLHGTSSSMQDLCCESQRSSMSFPVSAMPACPSIECLNEQEERIFYSLVDIVGPVTSRQSQSESGTTPKSNSSALFISSSPLSSPPSSPVLAPSRRNKENAEVVDRSIVTRRKRVKAQAVPLRRSTRMASKQITGPVTRSRPRKS